MESYEATRRSIVQNIKATNKRVSAPGRTRSKKVDVSGVVEKTVKTLLGTIVPNDAPLMGAGLDSLSAVDLVQTLGQELNTELEPTALFDYPTIGSLSKYLTAEIEPVDVTVPPSSLATSTKPRMKVVEERRPGGRGWCTARYLEVFLQLVNEKCRLALTPICWKLLHRFFGQHALS